MPELIALASAAIAFLFAVVLTPVARKVAIGIGFVDHPGERKIHTREIAYGGGLAVAAASALTVAILVSQHFVALDPKEEKFSWMTLAVVGAGALGALLLGLVDDKYKLSPLTKLVVQIALAIAAMAGGVRITAFIGDNMLMKCVTVLWIVLITNSLNLLDNMDGLCSGTVAIAATMLGVVALDAEQHVAVAVLFALAGACLGFLIFNRPPASIFLGDAGSLFVGYLMACLTAMVTYVRQSKGESHLAIGIPVLILAIPLYDTLSVIVIRLKERRPIMRGDTSHFSHRLVDLGMTRGQAVATIHLACLAIALPATVLGKLSVERGLLIVGQALLVLTIVALLERTGRNRARLNATNANRQDAGATIAQASNLPEGK